MPTKTTGFHSNSKKHAALSYGEEGFSIIPLHWITSVGQCSCMRSDCKSPAKHPLTEHGLKDACKDAGQIETWWKKFPKANIGVCTGSVSGDLIVVDVDVAKGANADDLTLPDTLKVETGAGYHLWFKADQPIRNSASKLGFGIDVRGEGGYVVAPPSIHHTGKQYSFITDDQIAEFPPNLIASLTQPDPKPDPVPTPDEPENLILSYSPGLSETDTATEGNRHAFLVSMGGRLRREGFSPEEIEAALLAANLKRCSPPVSDKRVRKIAHSLGRYTPVETIDFNVTDPEPAPEPAPAPDPAPDPDQTTQGHAKQSTQSTYDPFAWSGGDPLLGAITAEQLDLTVFSPPEMVLQGLFKGDWGIGVGIGSVGKTTFFHNACICLAAGRPFLPVVPENQGPRRILYLDFESNPWRLQWQIRKLRDWLSPEENLLVDQNLHFAIEPQTNNTPWRMTDRQSVINLAKYIQQHKIDLVIVDTYSQCADVRDENSNAEVQAKIVTPTRRLVKHTNCALLFLHHEGKGKKEQGESYMQYRARGASALIDASRYQITLIPSDNQKPGNGAKVVEIHNSKDKGDGFESVTMILDKATRWFSPIQAAPPPPKPKPIEETIIECLQLAGGPLTKKQIGQFVLGIPERTLFRKLRELVDDGEIVKVGHRYSVASPDPEAEEETQEEGSDDDTATAGAP